MIIKRKIEERSKKKDLGVPLRVGLSAVHGTRSTRAKRLPKESLTLFLKKKEI